MQNIHLSLEQYKKNLLASIDRAYAEASGKKADLWITFVPVVLTATGEVFFTAGPPIFPGSPDYPEPPDPADWWKKGNAPNS
jgi:hypothetical protein